MHYFENKSNNELFDYIFNHSLYESSGHPLFIYDDADKMESFLNKFKNIIENINKYIPKLRIEKEGNLSLENNPNRKYFVNVLKSFSIPITDFGFDDIIDVDNHKFGINIINVIDNDITYEDIINLTEFSAGEFVQIKNAYIEKNQYKNDYFPNIINGDCIAINGKILPQSFLSIFFHEYIHLYDNFNRLKTDKDNYLNFYNKVNDAAKRENQIKHYFSGVETKAMELLLYRLFNGEDNAIIGDLFADLISYNVISYNDYKRNIKYVRSFRIYEKCKNALNVIKDVDAFSLFEFLSDNPGFFTGYTDGQRVIKNILSEDYNAVKRKFIKILEKQLEKLYSKMLKFVGRYVYMMQTYNDKLVTNIKIQ